MIEFAIFALLPLGLLSFFGRHRRTDAGILPLLAALAPVAAKGAMSLIGHKQKQSAEKKQAEYDRQQYEAQQAQERARFEAAQNSPAKSMERFRFNMQLGRLLGRVGGRAKMPPSLLKQLDSARSVAQYNPGGGYTPKPKSGAGGWDFAAGLTDALSYFDPSKMKRPMSPGQPVGNIVPTMNPQPKPALVTPPGGIKRQPWMPQQ